MFEPRKPTEEEIENLKQYFMERLDADIGEMVEICGWINDAAIAVFDDYTIRGFRGKMLITIRASLKLEGS